MISKPDHQVIIKMNIYNIFVSFQYIILSELRFNFFYFYLYLKKKKFQNYKKIYHIDINIRFYFYLWWTFMLLFFNRYFFQSNIYYLMSSVIDFDIVL